MDAFVVAQASLFDLENRLRLATLAANEPFLFCTAAGEENFTGVLAWSLKGFMKALKKVDSKAVEFHNLRGDFGSWVNQSLQDKVLAHQLRLIQHSKLKGEELRKMVIDVVRQRFKKLSSQVKAATKIF
jgi:hypothetical protein